MRKRIIISILCLAAAFGILPMLGCSSASLKTTSSAKSISQFPAVASKQAIVSYCQARMTQDDALVSLGQYWLVDDALAPGASEKGIENTIIAGARLVKTAALGSVSLGTPASNLSNKPAATTTTSSTTASAATTTGSTTTSTTASTTSAGASTAGEATDNGASNGTSEGTSNGTSNGAGENTSNGGSANSGELQVVVTFDSSAASSYGKSFSLSPVTVSVANGATVFDALMATGVYVDYRVDSTYGAYVQGINGLNEFDCGSESGWIYKIDGSMPSVSAGNYQLTSNCTIAWVYVTTSN